MDIQYYVADAFTDKLFHGNPAGVCILEKAIDDELMQNIAFENNLSETAFLVKESAGRYHLRWFTPVAEIDLCGHATLASAFILSTFYGETGSVEYDTMSGTLKTVLNGDTIYLDFPATPPQKIADMASVADALGEVPDELYLSRDLMAVFKNDEQVLNLKPDFDKLVALDRGFGVIATAPGVDVDFVSRFFAVSAGICEDPVTGSSHTTLIPFWSKRLGKDSLVANQLSKRGGRLWCKNAGERVIIGGKAVLYSKGQICFG